MGSRGRTVLIVLLAASAAAAIGFWSYNAGVAQGMVEAGRIASTTPGGAIRDGTAPPYPYMWHRPWGFGPGFGFFPFGLLFVLLWFFALRGLFWRRSRWWSDDGRGIPRRFEEWHRRAHEQDRSVGPAPGTTA
jgi:hypothetical protein